MGKGSRFSFRKLLSRRSPARSKSPLANSVTPTPSTPSATSATTPSVASTPQVANIGASASSGGSSPWEQGLAIAQKKLSELGLPPLYNIPGQSASEIIEAIVSDLQISVDNANQISNKAVARRLREIVKTFDGYAKIVDMGVQHSPEITALVWAGLRTILQVALNYIEVTESLEAATAIIVEKMAVCEFFASIYEETRMQGIPLTSASITHHLQQALDLALPEFYAAILVFSVKAKQFFDPSTHQLTKWKYMLKPFALEFQPFINEISEKERRVRDCADMATMERIKRNSSKLVEIHSSLINIQSKLIPLTKLDDIMNFMTDNLKVTKNIQSSIEDERVQRLLQILTPLESLKRHQDVRSSRLEGTGTWLLQDKRFLQWQNSSTLDQNAGGNILCCYGNPGAGKTVISSIVVDNLMMQFSQQSNIGIAVIYCDYRDQTSQTLVNILGSLLWQLLVTASNIPDKVKERLDSIQKQRKRVEVRDISQMLQLTLAQFQHTFICIDALDELEHRIRIGLLTSIRDDFSTARIFLTGRPIIQQDVNHRLKTQQDAINIIPDLGDIRAYLEYKIKEDSDINPDAMNDKLNEEILSTITTRSKGMFLLPALHISMVLAHETVTKRRKALERLPSSLDDVFSGMVNRILGLPKPKDVGKRTLLLLHLAYRPLKLQELRHALSVELGDTELDLENMPSRKTILDCCLGLVIVDEETMTVRFVHYTLEEHFKMHGSAYFLDRYSKIAGICLTYLNYGKLSCHCATADDLQRQETEFAFLEYAACQWGHYALKQSNDSVIQLALKLLRQGKGGPPSSFQMLYRHSAIRHDYWGRTHTLRITGVHVAAYFGLEKCLAAMAGDIQHWDSSDEVRRTPLSWAAENGHEGVVKLLLGRHDVNADSMDNSGRSPLSWAAGNGHEAIVELLLERDDVDTNSKDNSGRSPLSWAAERGHEVVVGLLLGRNDADADSKSHTGRSPLSWAAENGHEAVVGLLLERDDVDADSKSSMGQSPLSWAAEKGHEAVVRLLLGRDDVEADSKSHRDRSPLSWAAENGHEAVVRLLLERSDVDANSKDTQFGRSPLSWAARYGHEAVVRLLLGRADVDADSKDKVYGRSPLSWAANYGHEAVVRLLLGRDDVDANSKDNSNRLPLSWAAENGHEAVVKLLLEQADVDANSKDPEDGQSPLSLAARYGREAVVRLLLEQGGVDTNLKSNNGRSPLSWAAENGHEAVVRLLLGRADVDTNSKSNSGRSPLSWAALYGHVAVVRLLLVRADVDADCKDTIYGRSPLSWAAERGHEAVVRVLLGRADVDANSKDTKYGRSPLSWAAGNRHGAVVRLLLEQADVDANSRDTEYGRSPLSWAAENGYEAVVRLFLERDDVDADSKDNSGRSPLSRAAERGREAVVRLLLEQDDADANSKDNSGRSPLLWAAEKGHEAVVRLLLGQADVNANSRDTEYGRTPISWAARYGHKTVVELLLGRGDVDANSRDNNGWSPVLWAARYQHGAIVGLLLGHANVDANSKDTEYSRTALSWAAVNGHEAMVRLLLERDDVDANSKDTEYGRTPLSWAVVNGHDAIVRLLLGRDDIDADSKDSSGRSPLSWAAEMGHNTTVRLLLERDDVDADSKDNSGRSPLSRAAEKGHKVIVRLLLKRKDVDADSKDNNGRSPLSWAAERGHKAIVHLLRQRIAISLRSS